MPGILATQEQRSGLCFEDSQGKQLVTTQLNHYKPGYIGTCLPFLLHGKQTGEIIPEYPRHKNKNK
jgi:hypothetical protein